MLSAMLDLEKARLSPDGWLSHIEARGARWRLVFTSDSKQVQAAAKRQPNKGGVFFPIAACQRFEGGVFENGVFLGPLASLTFSGPFKMEPGSRQISFDVVRMDIGIGPWRFGVPLKKGAQAPAEMADGERKKLPFFLYAYADGAHAAAADVVGLVSVCVCLRTRLWLLCHPVAVCPSCRTTSPLSHSQRPTTTINRRHRRRARPQRRAGRVGEGVAAVAHGQRRGARVQVSDEAERGECECEVRKCHILAFCRRISAVVCRIIRVM
jgi:hypothetical protein